MVFFVQFECLIHQAHLRLNNSSTILQQVCTTLRPTKSLVEMSAKNNTDSSQAHVDRKGSMEGLATAKFLVNSTSRFCNLKVYVKLLVFVHAFKLILVHLKQTHKRLSFTIFSYQIHSEILKNITIFDNIPEL